MQLYVEHDLPQELVLPINYHHILQAVIYNGLRGLSQYGTFVHDKGYGYNERQFRVFTFSLLKGRYRIENGNIIFREKVAFEVRSPEVLFIKLLAESIARNGVRYLNQHFDNVNIWIGDDAIEKDNVRIKLISPVVVYETDTGSGKTHYLTPDDDEFAVRINRNFMRKYFAYTGVPAESEIVLKPLKVTDRDKYVTKYKGIYIGGYFGEYELSGARKYLDFLYQTGIGSKNSQGFGMFDVIE